MATDDGELNYNVEIKPVIGDFDDEADQEAFVAMQEANVADAERISEAMSEKCVPDAKKPI